MVCLFSRKCEVPILLGDAVLDILSWRWLTLFRRPRVLFDAWQAKRGREKFARDGFIQHPAQEPSRAA